jgi:hypothetical protein
MARTKVINGVVYPLTAEEEAEADARDAAWAAGAADRAWAELRAERDRLLAETDWMSLRAVDASADGLGLQLPQVWVDYRQALRDLPANTADPANPVWPTKPS